MSFESRNPPPAALQRPARGLLAWVGAGLLLGPLLLAGLLLRPQADVRLVSPPGHFWVVGVTALGAVGLATLILHAAITRHDGRVLLIGLGFAELSAIFLIHAISTPGVLFDATGYATAVSTPLAFFVSAVIIALSASNTLSRQSWLIDRWPTIVGAGVLLWTLYSFALLIWLPGQFGAGTHTEHMSGVPLNSAPAGYGDEGYGGDSYGDEGYGGDNYDATPNPGDAATPARPRLAVLIDRSYALLPFITATSIVLFGLAALLYGQRWRREPTRPLAAMTIATVLLAEAALAAQLSQIWQLSFWLYHVLLFSAVGIVAAGTLRGYEQSGSLSSSVEGLLLASTLERQRAGFQNGMAALLAAFEQGDTASLPQLKIDLRRRFGLAQDQVELLGQAVQVVAQEREEQRRLRALAEVSRAATLDLDPNLLLQNAAVTFNRMTGAPVCAIGVVEGGVLSFWPQHRVVNGQPGVGPVRVPVGALPNAWFFGDDAPLLGEATTVFADLLTGAGASLALPLSYHDHVMGVLVVEFASTSIDAPMIAICSSISVHLATALSNARLFYELQEKHENLMRLEQTKDQLTQMIVHDLKNPLTAIISYLDMLKMFGLSSEQQSVVDGARRSSQGMQRLVADILDIARMEEGRLELRRQSLQIGPLLVECVNELRGWAEQEDHVLQVAPAGAERLLLDADLIRRVLINLLSNAIKHTPAGTTITLGLTGSASTVRLWVHDTGPGIPLERQQALFERFSAGEASGGRQSNTGLGLTFCKLATEAHGGTIAVDSVPGQGTTFSLVLPASVIQDQALTV